MRFLRLFTYCSGLSSGSHGPPASDCTLVSRGGEGRANLRGEHDGLAARGQQRRVHVQLRGALAREHGHVQHRLVVGQAPDLAGSHP